MRNRKIKLLLIFSVLSIFLYTNFALALEIKYPDIPNAISPSSPDFPTEPNKALEAYIEYFINLAIWITGFLAFGVLLLGGVRYLTSTGKPETISSARDQMSAGVFGILVLLSSYLVLKTLNPQLIKPGLSPLPTVNMPNLEEFSRYPVDKFRSLINAVIPFGSLIEQHKEDLNTSQDTPSPETSPKPESIFEGWRFSDEQKETGRMDRIRELASNTEQIANKLKEYSGQLKDKKEGCRCESVGKSPNQPWGVCDGWPDPSAIRIQLGPCLPSGNTTSLQDMMNVFNPQILDNLSNIVGPANLETTLGIGESIAGLTGTQENFTQTLSSITNIANLNPTNLSNVFGTAGNLGNLANSTFINPSDLFGSLNNFSNLPGITSLNLNQNLNFVSNIVNPIGGIIQNPTNLSSIFGSTSGTGIVGFLNNAGVNQGIINQVGEISGIVTGTIDNPANFLSTVTNTLQSQGLFDQYRGVVNGVISPVNTILNTNPTFTSIAGLDGILSQANIPQNVINSSLQNFNGNFGDIINTTSQNPTNINDILQSINTTLTSASIGGPDLNNLSGVRVLDIVSPLQNIISNPRDFRGIVNNLVAIPTSAGINMDGLNTSQLGDIIAPLNNVMDSLSNGPASGEDFQTILSDAVGEILKQANGQLPANTFILNVWEIIETIINVFMEGGDISDLLEQLNEILSNPDETEIIQDFLKEPIANLQNIIIQSPNNCAGILGATNNILITAGADITITDALQMITTMASPLEGIINNPRDIQNIFSSTRTILEPWTSSLEETFQQINVASNIVSPIQGLMQDPWNMSNFFSQMPQIFSNVGAQNINELLTALNPIGTNGIGNIFGNIGNVNSLNDLLRTLINSFSSLGNISSVFQSCQNIASTISNPSNFGDLMNQFGGLSDIVGHIQDLEYKNLNAIYGSYDQGYKEDGGENIAYEPQSCLGESGGCQTKQITTNLIKEQNNAVKEVKELKESIARLEEAERFMLACPSTFLLSLPEFLSGYDFYADKGWFLKEVKYWEQVVIDSRGGTVNCPVSGTIWEEGKQVEGEEKTGTTLENPFTAREPQELLGCTVEIPAGEIIDRAKRLGYKLVERLETLINLDQKIIKAVDDLHKLISQCSSQSPRCCTACITYPVEPSARLWACIPTSLSGSANPNQAACPNDEITKKVEEIENLYKRKDNKDPQGIKDVIYEAKPTTGGGQTSNYDINKLEETGIKTIIDEIVPMLNYDLDALVRTPTRNCVTPPQDKSAQSGRPTQQFISCDGSLKTVGPEGATIEQCCYPTDKPELEIKGVPSFDDCSKQCYLESEYKKGGGNKNEYTQDYSKCLFKCLEQKAQNQNNPDLKYCINKVNFYCCDIRYEFKKPPEE